MAIAVRSMVEYVGGRSLARFLFPANPELKPHEILRNRLISDTKSALRAHGIELIDIRLGRLIVPNEVTRQLIDKWQAMWIKRRIVSDEQTPFAVESRVRRELLNQLKGQVELGYVQDKDDEDQALYLVDRLNQLTQSNAKLPLLESQIARIRDKIKSESDVQE